MDVFLFGAGASFGSGNCIPHPPPLGTQLFDILDARGGFVSTLSDEQKSKFRPRFEVGMAALYEESNMLGLALLREMGGYFAGFLPGHGNYYIELISHLKERRKPFTLATTNYDLLIEFVINAVGSKFNYVPHDAPDQIVLYKIHGSCNFLPYMGNMRITGATYFLAPGDLLP